MICKRGVHAGEFDFRHVTARAVLCAHRASRGAAAISLCFLRGRQMTRETLAVVIRRVMLQLLVRIVTRETRDARIVRVVTTAIEYPIRLKPNVVNSRLPRLQHCLLKTRVTRPAERLRQIERAEPTGIEDLRLVKFLFLHRDEMLLAWSMTRFTANAWT